MDTIELKVGYVLLRHGEPVKTGRRGAQTAKLYQHAGTARRQAARTTNPPLICEAYIKVPAE